MTTVSCTSATIELRKKIRWAEEPDNPALIQHWMKRDRCCATADDKLCRHCSITQQRQCYEQQFRLLLETLADEILPGRWRCVCLDNIYRPLHKLKLLSTSPHTDQHIQALIHELAITSRYVSSSLYNPIT